MPHRDDDSLPAELREIAERLRRERMHPGPLDLDRIKLRVIRRADAAGSTSGGSVGPRLLRTRLAGIALAIAALIVGGGAILGTANGLPDGGLLANYNAAHKEYCPPGSHDRDNDDDDDDDRRGDRRSRGQGSQGKQSTRTRNFRSARKSSSSKRSTRSKSGKKSSKSKPKSKPKPKPKPKPTDCDDD